VGLGGPILVVVVWSMFVAPGTDNGLSTTTKTWLGSAILGACAIALAAAKRPALAGVFAAATVADAVLMQVWHQ